MGIYIYFSHHTPHAGSTCKRLRVYKSKAMEMKPLRLEKTLLLVVPRLEEVSILVGSRPVDSRVDST